MVAPCPLQGLTLVKKEEKGFFLFPSFFLLLFKGNTLKGSSWSGKPCNFMHNCLIKGKLTTLANGEHSRTLCMPLTAFFSCSQSLPS